VLHNDFNQDIDKRTVCVIEVNIMAPIVKRKVIYIDETKCNGCGVCIPACAEGALQIVDGKARLVSEKYCDGLGACLGECPQGALTIVENEVDVFNEAAAKEHQAAQKTPGLACPSRPSLRQWPVQLALIPPAAPFLQGADILLVADCVPFAYPALHEHFIPGHALLVACPKLDDYSAHEAKLTEIIRHAQPKSLSVMHMEVPCCYGLVQMAREAIRQSSPKVPLKEITVGVRGDIKKEGATQGG
jgi:ferredoxin